MKKKTLRILIILMIIFIWGQSAIPMTESAHESEWLRLKIINPVLNFIGLDGMSSNAVRKAAHITEYAILAILLAAYWETHHGAVILFGFITAFIDESIQILSSRGSMVMDVWIDMIGIVAGFLLCRLIQALSKKKRRRL
jgi:VanZ family protein